MTAYAPLPDVSESVLHSFTRFGYGPNVYPPGRGNLTSVRYGADPHITFGYDPANRRTNMTDGVGTTAWTYDPLDRLASETGPFNQAVSVGYDTLGRLTNIAYGGYTWLYGYDGGGRIISIDAPEGSYSFLYHQNGFKPSLVTYPNGITADRDYDALTRLENLDYSPLFDIAYAHDANDRRTNESWSTGRAITYGYDDAGQLLSAVSTARPSDNAAYVYDEAGNPLRRTELGIGVTNAFNNLNQQLTSTFTGGAITVVGEVNYPAGTVTVNTVTAELHGVTFEAEGLSLSAGTNAFTAVYVGPAFTNTPMVATDIVEVVVGDVDYGFDLNGNMTNDAVFAYQFDAANRLTNVIEKSSGDSVLAARYDGLGRRVEVTRNETNTERYVYLPGTFSVLAVLDSTNGVKEVYTHGPDLSGTLGGAGGIGSIHSVTLPPSSDTRYFHADAMGNIVAVTDEQCNEIATYTYAAFGRVLSHTGEFDARFQFSSKEFDAETGLLNFGLRYLSASSGRWTQRDPAGELFSENLYRYAANNPLLYADALGLAELSYNAPITQQRRNLIVVAGPDVGYGYAEATFTDVVGFEKRRIPATPRNQGRAFAKGFNDKKGQSLTAQTIGALQGFSFEDLEAILRAIASNPSELAKAIAQCAVAEGIDITTTIFDIARFYSSGDKVSAAHTLGELTGQYGDQVLLAALGPGAIRLRHFTSKSGLRGIEGDNVIRALDRNRVFTTKARGQPGSPRDVESTLGIRRGRANAFIEFDALPDEIDILPNPRTGVDDITIRGDVDLSGRNPEFFLNR